MGAIVFVLGTITSRMQEGSNSHCKDATVSIGSIGALAGVTPQGNNVELTLKDGRNVKLVTVDKCTGAILHTLTVAP